MAATNFTPIQLYFSTTASAAPTAANLAQGELAINITDGKLYYEDNGGVVQVIATKGAGTIGGSTTQIQYNNAGALAGNAAMVFDSGTSTTTLTTLNLTNALGAIYGGTAQSTYAQGDIVYASATNTLSKLGIGTVNYILTSSGSVPQWVAPSSIAVLTATNLDGGAAGSVPYQSGVATTTFLAIGTANRVMTSSGTAPQWVTSLTGLTGVSSSSITNTGLTAGRVVISSTAGLESDSANLTFDGTTLSTTGLSNTGFSTLVKTLTLGNSSFNGTAVFAAATPANLYMGTGTVTDVTSAISATNTTGAIASLAITPIAATNTGVTYTNASTLYIAGAPSAGTNITITNPYSLYVAAGAVNLGGNTAVTGALSATGTVSSSSTSGYMFSASGSSTSAKYAAIANTSGVMIVGVESSAGGSIITGSSAYDSALTGKTGIAFSANDGSGMQMRLSSTGLAVTGTLSASGAATASAGLTVTGKIEIAQAGAFPTTGFAYNTNGYLYTLGGTSGVITQVASTNVTTASSTGLAITGLLDISAATSGQINFPATQNASANANTLDDYEEGTWTPNQGAGLTVVGAFSSSGIYTKIGRQVTVTGKVTGATSVAVSSGGVISTNLPFTPTSLFVGSTMDGSGTVSGGLYANSVNVNAVEAMIAGSNIYFTITYTV